MKNLKDVIGDLKKARNKCVNTVDKSTLKKIDIAIERLELELEQNKEKQPSKIKWLSLALKVLTLIRLAMGDVDG